MIERLRELVKRWRALAKEMRHRDGYDSAAACFEQTIRELEGVLPRANPNVVTVVAVFFALNGHEAHFAYEYSAGEKTSGPAGLSLLFAPPGRWDDYGAGRRFRVGDDGEPDNCDVVELLAGCGQISMLVMNRPERGPELEPWPGTKAREAHWAWAAGVWAGAAQALGCTRIKTVAGAQSVEQLLAVGRQAVGA